jgi:RNA polymerase sigma factor (TIGR02999 family)
VKRLLRFCLVGAENLPGTWEGRGHFFAAAAEAMRRILVESTRRKRSRKRGGGRTRQTLDPDQVAAPEVSEDLLALDEALNVLAQKDRLKAELVKLRYFAGLTIEEAADVLDISTATAKRWWTYARAWLYQEITHESSAPTQPSPTRGGRVGRAESARSEKGKKSEKE